MNVDIDDIQLTITHEIHHELNVDGIFGHVNDGLIRSHVQKEVSQIMSDLLIHRGTQLVDYVIECDAKNNTADVIRANKLKFDVWFKTTLSDEWHKLPFVVGPSS